MKIDRQMPEYAAALQLHHEIESLYPRIEQQRVWFRGAQLVGRNVPLPPGNPRMVETDRVFCALAIKAATTKRAVVSLADADDGDNAIALSRVLTENACLMQW